MTTTKAEILECRLPLLEPQALSPTQKVVYDRLNETIIRWAEKNHF